MSEENISDWIQCNKCGNTHETMTACPDPFIKMPDDERETMKTIIVQIGNSDDKLMQRDWNQFVIQTGTAIECAAKEIYFFGGPCNHALWQNVCWIFRIQEGAAMKLQHDLKLIRAQFRQDSLAWTDGLTSFI